MAHHPTPTPIALAAAALLAWTTALAQAQSGDIVTITGRSHAESSIGGFGNVPLARTPMQASVYGREALADGGVTSIAELTRLDASLADAYNAEGYWSFLTLRGFVIDNRANYRRDGLPINAETFISLANIERIEVLKGTSGIQAGTSAPGGIVNLVVKRPTASLRQGTLSWQQDGTANAQVDLSQRFGSDGQFGARLNLQAARLRPATRNANGESHAFALATDWQPNADSQIEFELESSHRSQPSVPGFSLLGNRVPAANSIDPRSNLNNQAWSLPVVLDGDTASLRFTRRLNKDWRFVGHGAAQRLRSDDRVAFPYGCYDAASDIYRADRYCPNGNVDLYDFRSEGERRRVDALDLRLEGAPRWGDLQHRIEAGMLSTRSRDRFGRQAFNFSGSANINANVMTPAAPELTDENTNRDERSTEWYVRDAVQLNGQAQLWAGLRHSKLDRRSVRTNGSRATAYEQSFTTPWLALSWEVSKQTLAYTSWGQGVESELVPNRSRYSNRGAALPALKSRQLEAGIRYEGASEAWSVVAFDIRRPVAADSCSGGNTPLCTRAIDGAAHHRGIEAALSERIGAWSATISSLWLRATREGSADAAINGLRPTNVPAASLRLQLARDLEILPGLSVNAGVAYEGDRIALPDNSASVPSWTRIDLGARFRQRAGATQLLWRIDLQNATNHRAWREAPYQFSHAYLFPLAARSLRASVQADF